MNAEPWQKRSFDDLVRSRGSGSAGLPQTQWQSAGAFPVIGQGAELVEGWTDRADLVVTPAPGLVLYGGHTRRAKYVSEPFVPGPNVKILQPSPELNARFLYYFLTHLQVPDKGYADHFSFVRKCDVPVPPLAEQKRIVAVLDATFGETATARTNTAQNLRSVPGLVDSYLQAVFDGEGRAWERVRLAVLLDRGWILGHQDGNHGSSYPRKDEFVSSGVPYISANCIEHDRVDMSRAKYLSALRADGIRTGIARDNDILFAHNATVGPVAILHSAEERVVLGTSLTYYRCNPAYILPAYLASFMRTSAFRAQYMSVMAQSTRNQVPITKQREFFHIIPPLGEQQKVVQAFIEIFERSQLLRETYVRKLAAIGNLEASLLHHAFTGAL